MFTLLSKLVRKLTRAERNSLADKLINLAKQEETPDEQPIDPSGDGSDKPIIITANTFFSSMSAYSFDVPELMEAAMERKTFCGIIVRNVAGNMKMIVGHEAPSGHGEYNIILYMQGFGSSSTQLSAVTISRISQEWIYEFTGIQPMVS